MLAIGQPGFWQIVIVLALLLLFFGGSRLPKMARSLGASLTEFKRGLKGEPDDDEDKKISGGDGDKDESAAQPAPEKKEAP